MDKEPGEHIHIVVESGAFSGSLGKLFAILLLCGFFVVLGPLLDLTERYITAQEALAGVHAAKLKIERQYESEERPFK